ncbi:ATP-binding cassette domain-containing protein [Candidatus Peregrinibacteria bacterium]|nr:ATP-binding cassette domain-containing protein [Candidatus Peregrinibacteria bacterium]
MIELKNVSTVHGQKHVLKSASARFEPGETVAILGASGTGKSTLLSLFVGAVTPASGTVEIDGVDLKKVPAPVLQMLRRRVGIVFSDLKLLPDRTVKENIGYTLEVAGASDDVIEERIRGVMQQLDLTERKDAMPEELTRTQQLHVALARALAASPLILLVDDPFRMLDRHEVGPFLRMLRKMKTPAMTLICTTSDETVASELGGRTLELAAGALTPMRAMAASATEGRQSRSEHARVAPVKQGTLTEEIPLGVLADKSAKQAKAEGQARKIKVTAIGS